MAFLIGPKFPPRITPMSQEEYDVLSTFLVALRGGTKGFRFRDFKDYKEQLQFQGPQERIIQNPVKGSVKVKK